jgi:Fur family ferric uptake transcriptional regulator
MRDPSSNRALVQERARVYLRENGSKVTGQREKILEAIFSSHDHFCAEDLHAKLKAQGHRISIATIYRLINELVKGHFLRPLDDGSERHLYDPNYPTRPGHYHILCKDCGKMIEFEDPCLDLRERALVEDRGFTADELQVRVDANCKRHHASGDCPNKEPKGNAMDSCAMEKKIS